MKIYKHKQETIEIERLDGKMQKLTIHELPPGKLDEVFELMLLVSIQYHTIKNTAVMEQSGNKDAREITENLLTDSYYHSALQQQSADFWRLVTSHEDVSWVTEVYGSGLVAVMQTFEEVNPLLEEKKSLLSEFAEQAQNQNRNPAETTASV